MKSDEDRFIRKKSKDNRKTKLKRKNSDVNSILR